MHLNERSMVMIHIQTRDKLNKVKNALYQKTKGCYSHDSIIDQALDAYILKENLKL